MTKICNVSRIISNPFISRRLSRLCQSRLSRATRHLPGGGVHNWPGSESFCLIMTCSCSQAHTQDFWTPGEIQPLAHQPSGVRFPSPPHTSALQGETRDLPAVLLQFTMFWFWKRKSLRKIIITIWNDRVIKCTLWRVSPRQNRPRAAEP